jgi:O-antigen/teichoic acid export membrane protein
MRSRLAQLVSLRRDQRLPPELVRGGLGNVVLRIMSAVLGFAASVVLARLMGAERYGTYVYVLALVSVLAVPAEFGLPALVLRETAANHVRRHWQLIKGLWRYANLVATGMCAILVALGGTAIWFLTGYLTNDQIVTFAWGLVLVPLVVLGNLRGAALQGLRKVVLGRLPEYLVRPGFFIVFVLGVMFLNRSADWSASLVMQLQVLAAAVAFGAGAWLLRRERPAEVISAIPTYEARRWLLSIFPLALTAGMQLINHYTDIVMLGLLASAAEVGIYRAAVSSASLVVFGLQIVNLVVAPHFSRLHSVGDIAQLQLLATASARMALYVAAPVVIAFISFGDQFLELAFGREFAFGYAALVILALGQLVNAAAGSVGYLLNMTGHERDTVRGVAIAALTNVVLNLVLIPPFGMAGAATATAIALTVWNILLWHAVRNRLGINSMAFNFFGVKSKA